MDDEDLVAAFFQFLDSHIAELFTAAGDADHGYPFLSGEILNRLIHVIFAFLGMVLHDFRIRRIGLLRNIAQVQGGVN